MNLVKSDDLFLNIKNIFFYSILPVTSFQLSLPLMCVKGTQFFIDGIPVLFSMLDFGDK